MNLTLCRVSATVPDREPAMSPPLSAVVRVYCKFTNNCWIMRVTGMVHGTNYHPFNLLIESSAPLTDLLETHKSELKSTSISLMSTTEVKILLVKWRKSETEIFKEMFDGWQLFPSLILSGTLFKTNFFFPFLFISFYLSFKKVDQK